MAAVSALSLLDSWPCEWVAASHLDQEGTVDSYGPVDRPFALASVTKLLTSVAVLIAVEERTIDLHAPILSGGATVADMLGHAGGIAADGKRLDDPGRRRVYSNSGYEQVAQAVASRADMEFNDYVTEAVIVPLAMSSTVLTRSAAHGAVSTVSDLVKFVEGLPLVLSSETLDAMTSPYLPELIGVVPGYGRHEPNPWGLGPEIRGDKSPHWTGTTNSSQTWGHFGQAGTFLWSDPAAEQVLIVLTNEPFGDWALPLWPQISDAVLAEPR